MPTPINPAGLRIPADTAQLYMNTYLDIIKCLKTKVLSKLTFDEINANSDLGETKKHFSSEGNAFLFDKSTFEDFFNPKDGTEPAKYLMVIMGAKHKMDADRGLPTIVLTGVVDHPKEAGAYLSLATGLPAIEQPPRKVIISFPNKVESQVLHTGEKPANINIKEIGDQTEFKTLKFKIK